MSPDARATLRALAVPIWVTIGALSACTVIVLCPTLITNDTSPQSTGLSQREALTADLLDVITNLESAVIHRNVNADRWIGYDKVVDGWHVATLQSVVEVTYAAAHDYCVEGTLRASNLRLHFDSRTAQFLDGSCPNKPSTGRQLT